MKLEVCGKDVFVKFFHDGDEQGRWTEVVIQSDLFREYGEFCAEADHLAAGEIRGTSYCHPSDQFDKKKGRFVALNRAFYPKGKTRVSKFFTGEFWHQYFLKQPLDKEK